MKKKKEMWGTDVNHQVSPIPFPNYRKPCFSFVWHLGNQVTAEGSRVWPGGCECKTATGVRVSRTIRSEENTRPDILNTRGNIAHTCELPQKRKLFEVGLFKAFRLYQKEVEGSNRVSLAAPRMWSAPVAPPPTMSSSSRRCKLFPLCRSCCINVSIMPPSIL